MTSTSSTSSDDDDDGESGVSDARDARDDDDDDACDDDDDDDDADARDARERRLARWRRATGRGGGVAAGKAPTTVEYQRQQAKMMVKYFKDKQYEEAVEDAQVFGFTPKNEINNGRWTMFGLLVGMLTEIATGVDFPDQINLTLSVLGINRCVSRARGRDV
eukprot:CAMPEP_0179726280 /NCGR_PEP_ID=MMETSP0938-20121108/6995_1 /TAXON_ID=548131 ORGANISM="Ostreococcus mediterraneus, Strain clade-D-RCC1107" /NCGR_SAMPLE_ID=MMETSP0938 /ASSEMBLY_ACC=CAM_ASM_000576 /LENGTH=161 /DNA_ID=CAMNT_0021600413 /DNA_START=202 /DNA_END=689 /DNA_ORIENTATION=+